MINLSQAMSVAIVFLSLLAAVYGLSVMFFARRLREWQLKRLQAEMAAGWRVPADRVAGALGVLAAALLAWSEIPHLRL